MPPIHRRTRRSHVLVVVLCLLSQGFTASAAVPPQVIVGLADDFPLEYPKNPTKGHDPTSIGARPMPEYADPRLAPSYPLPDEGEEEHRVRAASLGTIRLRRKALHPIEWEGWGTSLAWWGMAVGGSSNDVFYADAIFTMSPAVELPRGNPRFPDGSVVPGLGFTIARYNIGGFGRPGDGHGARRESPAGYTSVPWFKRIEGFWQDWRTRDAERWDWDGRDRNQRRMLQLAVERGVDKVEMFSNAPMWWMTLQSCSAGGELDASMKGEFAYYMAKCVERAVTRWGVNVTSVEMFNEPSAGWWRFPHNQEGCNIDLLSQSHILDNVRHELSQLPLPSDPPTISASDENSMDQALRTFLRLHQLHSQLNVHAYNGLDPWRDNRVRSSVAKVASSHSSGAPRRVWMSEYGDNDARGLKLARTILEDLNHLRPSAWVYWQAVESAGSSWGLLNGDFWDERWADVDEGRARVTEVNGKYFVMAHFSRFIRPGARLIESKHPGVVAAYDSGPDGGGATVTIVAVNFGEEVERMSFEMDGWRVMGDGEDVDVTVTNTRGPSFFEKARGILKVEEDQKRVELITAPKSVYSVVMRVSESKPDTPLDAFLRYVCSTCY
ncbi:hypothetical protein HK101_004943 [Irineochytrium annulatum]|nr:hypothetical protein HK101_004943 [Irineochytrium annulatum]